MTEVETVETEQCAPARDVWVATVGYNAFRDALEIARRAVPTKTSLPVLGGVLVTVRPSLRDPQAVKVFGHKAAEVEIAGTDLDLWITATVDSPAMLTSDDRQARSVVIPAKELWNLVKARERDDENLNIAVETTPIERKHVSGAGVSVRVTLSAGTRHMTIEGLSPAEFPLAPLESVAAKERATAFRLPVFDATRFATAVKAASACVSKEDARPILNGVLFECDGDGVLVVACDGHRLTTIELTDDGETVLKPIVPVPALNAVVAAKVGDQIHATVHALDIRSPNAINGFIEFVRSESEARAVRVVSRLIEGPYPDYGQVLPDARWDKTWTVSTASLLAAAEAAKDATRPSGHRRMVLSLDNLQPGAIVTTNDADMPAIRHPVNGHVWLYASFKIGLNAGYLVDLLKKIEWPERVRLRFRDNHSAVELTRGDEDVTNQQLALLMPVRLLDDEPVGVQREASPETTDDPPERATDTVPAINSAAEAIQSAAEIAQAHHAEEEPEPTHTAPDDEELYGDDAARIQQDRRDDDVPDETPERVEEQEQHLFDVGFGVRAADRGSARRILEALLHGRIGKEFPNIEVHEICEPMM